MDDKRTPIKIVGIGDAGCNMVRHMLSNHSLEAEYIVMNNDLPSLNINPCPKKLHLDLGFRGEGQPGLCRWAAEQLSDKIKEALIGTEIVVVTVGLGGNCGTESAPVICEIAKVLGAVVVCAVTIPFSIEGKKRSTTAKAGLLELKAITDHIIVLENDTLFQMFGQNMTLDECFRRADDLLCKRLKEYLLPERIG